MKHFNELILYVIILKLFCQFVDCLYEDQIGKFDWRQQFIGRVNHVLRASDIWQDHQLLITSSHSGALSGLYLRNGTINWRNLLETSSIDLLSSWPKSMEFSCPVLTINGHGRWIRCWKTSGVLISEHFLPNTFLNEIETKSSDYDLLFETNRNTQQPMLLIAKISRKSYSIEIFHYDFRRRKLDMVNKLTAGKWLDNAKCSFITTNYLLCLDQINRDFYFINLESTNNKQFKQIPLSTFGLTVDQNNETDNYEKISIQLLPDISEHDKTTTISNQMKSKYFALNLGNGQGIVLFKIVANNPPQSQEDTNALIRLVKIFPYANRMTIIPLISSSSNNEFDNEQQPMDFGVAVMFTKPDSIPYEDKNDGEYEQKVFAIKLAIFHLESWTEITSISSKSILFEFGDKHPCSPISSNGKLVKRLNNQWQIDRFEIIPIRTMIQHANIRAMNRQRNQFRYTYKMLITTVDGTMIVTNLMGKINWSREESLAEINSMIMIDLPLSETDATLEQEYEDNMNNNQSNNNILTLFVQRIRSQLIQLLSLMRHIQQNLMNSMILLKRMNNNHDKHRINNQQDDIDDDNQYNSMDDQRLSNDDFTIDNSNELLIRDYFGFHKLIISRTKMGKIFAMDTITGNVIWSKYEKSLSIDSNENAKFPIWIQRTNAHYPYTAICTMINVIDDKTFLLSFDPFTGKVIDSKWLPYSTVQAMLIQTIHDDEFVWPLLMMDSHHKSYLYPDTPTMKQLFSRVSSKHFMMTLNETNAMISGYSFALTNDNKDLITIRNWNYHLPHESNKLISIKAIFKRSYENVHSQGRVLGDRNVLYKYLNPNLVAILIESLDSQDKSYITMYLIDSITGNIIYSIVHKRTKCPCQIVHSENSIIYSYYNDKMRRNEISSIELYEGYNQINSTAFSSFGRDLWSMPNVEQKSFIFPTGIGIMTDTETLKGITSKHILISLPTGGILELPRAFLDPRRPIRPTQEHAEEGLIPYVPELPIPSETIINYNQTVFGVRGIVTAPASLESTSLICVYGIDIYYTRVTPSKTFDILKDDFDHLLIMAVLLLLITMSYIVKYLASKKSLNAAWK